MFYKIFNTFCLAVLTILLLSACRKDNDTGGNGYEVGRNRFTIDIDGFEREYIVHVPSGYKQGTKIPMVFMLHGTSGDGPKFYSISGWKEVGEANTLITVYPSSWRYCIIEENGDRMTTTKWNAQPTPFSFCAGEDPKDDIKFLRGIISHLSTILSIDEKRIYLVGFSNGGAMAAKCAIELSDKLAAVVESAGTFSKDTIFMPKRKIPTLVQRGNEDYGPGNVGPAIPFKYFDSLINTPNLPFQTSFYNSKSTHIRSFGLENKYTVSGDTNVAIIATFRANPPVPQLEYNVVMIRGLEHNYPNGVNHPLKGAELNWQWLKQFSQ
jgi:polyhydroxybutyrate depolymerase